MHCQSHALNDKQVAPFSLLSLHLLNCVIIRGEMEAMVGTLSDGGRCSFSLDTAGTTCPLVALLSVNLTLTLLKELVESFPVGLVALLLEVHRENSLFLLIEVLTAQDGFMALLDHIHVVGVGCQCAVEEEWLRSPLLLPSALVSCDRCMGRFVLG